MTDETDIKIPPRLRLRIKDSATGSYPTIARIGDPDRKGTFDTSFDDTNTLIFSSQVVNMPNLLPVGNRFIGTSSSSLNVPAIVRKGISDDRISFTRGEDLKPFEESRLPPRLDDPFHVTGSGLTDVGFGFQSPLTSKTTIEIDLNPVKPYSAATRNGGVVGVDGNENTVPGNWDFNGTENYPMMYFNFLKQRWEGIGKGITATMTGTNGFLYENKPELSSQKNIENLTYGFAPSYGLQVDIEGVQAGIPISNFGFPSHPKFAATSSQVLDMSTLIDGPFVVEKIVYQFSASYKLGSAAWVGARESPSNTDYPGYSPSIGSLPPVTTFANQSASIISPTANIDSNVDIQEGKWGAPMSTFFILNQRGPAVVNDKIIQDQANSNDAIFGNRAQFISAGKESLYPVPSRSLDITIPSSTILRKDGPLQYVDTIRDIITFSQVVAFHDSVTDSRKKKLSRELNIKNLLAPQTSPEEQVYWSGKFEMSSTIKSPVIHNEIGILFLGINDSAGDHVSFYNKGSRNGIGQVSGRDLTSAVIGNQLSSSFDYIDTLSGFTRTITAGRENFRNSPYLLFPEDRLIFGWQVPLGKRIIDEGRTQAADGTVTGFASELTIHPGVGKLIFYGSQLRENQEFHDTLNQPLTSPAIHEDIHSNNPVLDQFDLELFSQFSGTYIDDVLEGSLQAGNPNIVSRNIIASRVTGAIDKTVVTSSNIPGFIRGVSVVSSNEIIFDSLVPRIDQIQPLDGAAISFSPAAVGRGNRAIVQLGENGDPMNPDLYNKNWFRAFPFEPRYSQVLRSLSTLKNTIATIDTTQAPLPKPRYAKAIPSFKWTGLKSGNGLTNALARETDLSFNVSDLDVAVSIFCVGDFASGTVKFVREPQTLTPDVGFPFGGVAGPIPRGFKYGLIGVTPTPSRAVFRRDRYGQLRDMLEQRIQTKFYDSVGLGSDGIQSLRPAATVGAVQIRFVDSNTGEPKDPYNTISSNVSTEATSSVPYFDNKARNREDPLFS